MKVEYVDHMGDDLSVVNAARVSFDKRHETFQTKDEGLIKYLARHNHWTPFAHTTISLRITAPIFVARQLFKHKVGFVENEVSRRYVDSPPEFFIPEIWRGRPKNAKQGSDGEVNPVLTNKWGIPHTIENAVTSHSNDAITLYSELLSHGVCAEQARMVLPQSMYTSWIWTASLPAYARFCKLRLSKDAQAESSEIAKQVKEIIEPLYPISWKALSTDYDETKKSEEPQKSSEPTFWNRLLFWRRRDKTN